MPVVDMPLEQLKTYLPPLTAEPDFDQYWSATLKEARSIPLAASVETEPYPVDGLTVMRATYNGWAGTRICGWYLVPERQEPLPTMVLYHGYSGNKGTVYDLLPWALQGYAVLSVDVRGQSGDSTDSGAYPGGHVKGWMTKGITDPTQYYYRGAYIDCVRALDFACGRPEVDQSRIGVTGGSQGGGLSLAVAALDRRPAAAMAGVPFLCHFQRATLLTDQQPYEEIRQYCRVFPDREEQVFRTLSYVDGMNLARRITCPTLVSVGLQDLICPPSTIFAAYNRLGSKVKSISIYPYNGHEGNPAFNQERLTWAKTHVLR